MKFYRSIAPLYDYIFPLNVGQVKFVQSYIPERGVGEVSLLDVGCATGNLAIACASDTVQVTGMDLDKEMIALAQHKKGASKSRFVDGDMLQINGLFKVQEFDCVSCFGNTIVHLPSVDAIADFFSHVHQVLKQDGVFLGQIINYDRIFAQDIHALPSIDNEHIRFVRDYHFEPNDVLLEFKTSLLVKDNAQVINNAITLIALKKVELQRLLSDAGFSTISFWGGFDRSSLQSASQSLVFAAHK